MAKKPHQKCPKCGESAVHLATAYVTEFYGDSDDDAGKHSRFYDVGTPTLDVDWVILSARICFECGYLVNVWIDSPDDRRVSSV